MTIEFINSCIDYLDSNNMIKVIGEYKPTIQDVINAKDSHGMYDFDLKDRTQAAIDKLTKHLPL